MVRKMMGVVGFWMVLSLFGLAHAQSTGTVTYVYTDHQGTPLAEADAQGNITATYDYQPYGAQALGTAPNGPGYTGHVNDPDTGLVYMQARYYDPTLARFLSVDPVTPSAGNGFNFNRYVYAENNPVIRTDPDGRDSVGEMIDQKALQAASEGSAARTYAWAFAATAWSNFGAEGVSQVYDKGSSAGTGNGVMAVMEVATLGKGGPLARVGEKLGAVTAKSLRSIGKSVFKDSKFFKMAQSAGKCAYCENPAEVGDHIKSLKTLAGDVNEGKITKGEAAEMAHEPGNINPACTSCNTEKGAQNLSTSPGDGGWVPPKDRE